MIPGVQGSEEYLVFRRSKAIGQQTRTAPSAALTAGTQAPAFNLPSSTGKEVSSSDYRGQPLVLVFYPADFSPVCGDQLVLYNELLSLFEGYGAQVLAISVDGVWCHKAFAENRNLGFPLLADYEPKGAVAQDYGVYDAQRGNSKRALFVIDSEGVVRWSHVSPAGVNPGADGILATLESL